MRSFFMARSELMKRILPKIGRSGLGSRPSRDHASGSAAEETETFGSVDSGKLGLCAAPRPT
jgi:hypothetical protein